MPAPEIIATRTSGSRSTASHTSASSRWTSGSTALRPGPSSTTCSTPGAGRSKRRLGKRGVADRSWLQRARWRRASTTTATRPRCAVRRAATFGTACSHRSWVAPPITSRSPEPGARSRDGPPVFGLDEERPAGAERQDRDDRVVELAQLTVAVRRDAVATVAVVVEPGSAQPHAVPRLERSAARARSAGCRGRSARRAKHVSRGSSTIRSYIQRRPCCHSIESTSSTRSVSPPRSQPGARSTHAWSSSQVRVTAASGSRAGGPMPSREVWCGGRHRRRGYRTPVRPPSPPSQSAVRPPPGA